MKLLLLFCISVAGVSAASTSAKQPQNACFPNTDFCSPTVLDKTTGISLKFAVPSSNDAGNIVFSTVLDDFVAQVITPEPYGYAGFTASDSKVDHLLGRGLLSPPSSLLWWELRNSKLMTVNNSASAVFTPNTGDNNPIIVQLSRTSDDGKSFLPVQGGAIITISPFSYITENYSFRIFRCQKCSIASNGPANSPHLALSVFLSSYDASDDEVTLNNSTLPIEDITVSSVLVNLQSAHTSKYGALLEALKLA